MTRIRQRAARLGLAATLLAGALVGSATSAGSATGDVARRAGSGRVETAVEISKGAFTTSTTAVIATAATYPDALAGGVLAAKLSAPLLLSTPDDVPGVVLSELDRLGATDVVLLGGVSALSAQVQTTLEGRELAVDRIAGRDRFDTATRVADRVTTDPGTVVVVTGQDFPDAVSVSAYAAANQWPILLTARSRLPTVVRDYLGARTPDGGVIVGGPSAVSQSVADEVADFIPGIGRIAGANRFETSFRVAEAQIGADTVWLATGSNFPDALSAGAAVAATDGVLVLTPSSTTDLGGDTDVRALIEGRRTCNSSGPLAEGVLAGGTSALSTTVEEQVRALLRCEAFPTPPEPQPQPQPSPSPTQGGCHPAYPDFCIAPPPPDLDCSDFTQKRFTVRQQFGDPHRLDRDGNGIACES